MLVVKNDSGCRACGHIFRVWSRDNIGINTDSLESVDGDSHVEDTESTQTTANATSPIGDPVRVRFLEAIPVFPPV